MKKTSKRKSTHDPLIQRAVGIIIDGTKMGVYQVKKNVIKYGDTGYRQEITLGLRIG